MISFWHGKTKVWVSIEEQTNMSKKVMPLYTEGMNMLDALADEEVDGYLEENPRLVPLFEVDVEEAVSPYIVQTEDAGEEPNKNAIRELRQAQETWEREMVVSVKNSTTTEKELVLKEGLVLLLGTILRQRRISTMRGVEL